MSSFFVWFSPFRDRPPSRSQARPRRPSCPAAQEESEPRGGSSASEVRLQQQWTGEKRGALFRGGLSFFVQNQNGVVVVVVVVRGREHTPGRASTNKIKGRLFFVVIASGGGASTNLKRPAATPAPCRRRRRRSPAKRRLSGDERVSPSSSSSPSASRPLSLPHTKRTRLTRSHTNPQSQPTPAPLPSPRASRSAREALRKKKGERERGRETRPPFPDAAPTRGRLHSPVVSGRPLSSLCLSASPSLSCVCAVCQSQQKAGGKPHVNFLRDRKSVV